MNTKHSGEVTDWQAVFDAQETAAKTTTKTASWERVSGISKVFPPPVHRLVHNSFSRRTVTVALQNCDNKRTPYIWGQSVCGATSGSPFHRVCYRNTPA
jgi:hypothetical protein